MRIVEYFADLSNPPAAKIGKYNPAGRNLALPELRFTDNLTFQDLNKWFGLMSCIDQSSSKLIFIGLRIPPDPINLTTDNWRNLLFQFHLL